MSNLPLARTSRCSGGCKGPSTARELHSSHRSDSNSGTLSIIELKGAEIYFLFYFETKIFVAPMKHILHFIR